MAVTLIATRNPKELQDSPDIINLIYTDEYDVIENLRQRHANKHVYTGVSDITLAMNPYRKFPIYGKDKIESANDAVVHGTASKTPHVYNLSVHAFLDMNTFQRNNSIIVSGESGAGKTENAKRLMEALSAHSTLEGLESKIFLANPIFETFGNAKTVMNNNSSRFGKFTKMLFEPTGPDSKLGLTGARIQTYLLEKSRIVIQGIDERNYHSFYTVFKAQEKGKGSYRLEKMKKYHYLYGNGPDGAVQSLVVPGRDENAEYEELEKAWKELQFPSDAPNDIYSAVASVLHLGQLVFEKTKDGFGEIRDNKKSKAILGHVATLLSVKVDVLKDTVQNRTMKVGKKTIHAKLTHDDALFNRDALAKTIYHRLFHYVVTMTAHALAGKETKKGKFIGILDIFGFENFEVNSLEQLCINYCNETLQQFFNERVVVAEQEEYLREGVPWSEITVPSNKDMVKLITHKKKGIFFLTDNTCQMPKGTSHHLYDLLIKKCKKNPKFLKKRPKGKKKKEKKKGREAETFTIIHYAAVVTYECDAFLEKNRDSLHVDTVTLLDSSSNKVVKAMIVDDVKAMKQKKKSFEGIGTSFMKSLHELLGVLTETRAWFLRCLNPNTQKSPTLWEEEHVRNQLRCNGIIECIKVMKLGYPSRTPHDYVIKKFSDSLKSSMGTAFTKMTKRKQIQCILYGLGVPPKEYELGFTKVFFRPNPKPILIEITNHSGTFNADEIEIVKKMMASSLGTELTGLLKAYLRMGRKWLIKFIMEDMKIKVAQMLWVSRFVTAVQEIQKELNIARPPSPSPPPPVEVPSVVSVVVPSEVPVIAMAAAMEDEATEKEAETEEERQQRVLRMMAEAWSHNSVVGETFMMYGDEEGPKETLLRVDQEGNTICWNDEKFPVRDIRHVRKGITTEDFKKYSEELDDNLCFSIIFDQKTLNLLTEKTSQRKVWVTALKLMKGRREIAELFRKLRAEELNKP